MILYSVDTETTGTNPLECALREIALVPLDAGFMPDESKTPFVRTLRIPVNLADEGFKWHGLEPWIGDAPVDVHGELLAYLEPEFALLGRNVGSFDGVLLRRFCGEDVWKRCSYHYRDTSALQLACQDLGLLPAGRLSLKTLAEALALPWEGERHRAQADACMAAACYRSMLALLKGARS